MSDLEALKNLGIRSLGPAANEGAKTVIVVGVARGGTSVVAGALASLGVFMGDKAARPVFEDTRLARAIESDDWSQVREIVAEYDERASLWGFKRPSAVAHLARLHPLLRNPAYVVIFRDLLATANRNVLSMRADLLASLRQAHQANDSILAFLAETDSPCLLLSNEKVVLRRELFVQQLVDFLKLGPHVDPDQYKRAVQFIAVDPPDYLDKARLQFQGHVDRLTPLLVSGWAHIKHHPAPAVVEVHVNDALVGTSPAKRLRKDVKNRGLHPTGRCGFWFEFPPDRRPRVGDRVSVRFELGGDELSKSPRVLAAGDALADPESEQAAAHDADDATDAPTQVEPPEPAAKAEA